MTNQKNSYIAFLVGCSEDIKDIVVPDGFSLTKKEYARIPYTWIYTLRIADPKKTAAVVDPQIEIINALDNTKNRTLEIILHEVVSTISSTDARANVAGDGLSIELDVAKMNADPTPVAATLQVPAGSSFSSLTSNWLESMGTGGNPDGSVNIQLSLKTAPADFDNCTFEITNGINGKTDIITIKAVVNKPALATSAGTGLGNSLNAVTDGDGTVTLELANNNHADFTITCADGVTPQTVTGLKIEAGVGNLYTITIEDATQFTDGGTAEVTFENTLYPLLSQKVTVTFIAVP